MKYKTRWRLILQWAAAASVCTFLLWIPLAALAGSVSSRAGAAAFSGALFLYALYSPFLAPLIIFVTVPAYVVLLWLWSWVCRRHPWVDARWSSILAATGVMSLPLAVLTAALCARGPIGVDYRALLVWAPCTVAMFWAALALPRWLLDSLHAGVFSGRSCAVGEA